MHRDCNARVVRFLKEDNVASDTFMDSTLVVKGK